MPHGIWHELIHLGAAAVLLGGGALFVFLSIRAGRGSPPSRPIPAVGTGQLRPVLTILAATLSVAAASIHLAAAPVHLEELGLLGWGFVGAALFQGAWALSWAIQLSRGIALYGIVGSVAILAAWAWTRTVGLSVGASAAVPEAIGVPDAAATTFELLLISLLAIRIGGVERRLDEALRRLPALPAIALVPAVGVVFLATTLAVSLALGHSHAPGEAPDHGAASGLAADPGH